MTRSIFLSFFVFLLVMAMPSMSQAKGSVKVGDTVPHNLELKDSNGKMRSFSDLKGEKGLTLVFIRSAEWCPFCQKQLIELSKNAAKFNEAGYPVVTVSYDGLEQLNKFVTKNKPKITLLSDQRSESIRAFGILNEANAKGTFSYGIPHPGVYIVSKDKKVQAKFFKGGYKERPSAKTLLAKIKELNPPPVKREPVVDDLEGLGEDPIVPGEDVIEVPEKIIDPAVPVEMPEGANIEPDVGVPPSVAPENAVKTPTEPPVSVDVSPVEDAPDFPAVSELPKDPPQGLEEMPQ